MCAHDVYGLNFTTPRVDVYNVTSLHPQFFSLLSQMHLCGGLLWQNQGRKVPQVHVNLLF